MKSPSAWPLIPLALPLGAALLLLPASGCGDGTVNGAGSIDVPKPAPFEAPTRSSKGGKAAGTAKPQPSR
ncbi:hypothetical protein OJF2_33670 [Aquisphaera giovannonii]|uniref:Uncharacterized protein n=1 Tax=Aquisphaera giovannonii TaxID=406548 RepID=A0A5B9W2B4_9BACT|nr:hypothetical protein [Aquisphaera giovannonii]QEH34822.1 hypothetical protein OJF2_33670 [Aquisphaera giovannonii]